MRLTMIKRYGAFVAVLGIALATGVCEFTGCFGFCSREVEIVPGLRWQYCTDRYSRLIWDGFGVVADGQLNLEFCDYGLYVCCRDDGSAIYLNLLERRVAERKNAGVHLLKSAKSGGLATDAASAMGIYSNYGKVLFDQAVNALRERIKRKLQARPDQDIQFPSTDIRKRL